jgi:hypothetical protein
VTISTKTTSHQRKPSFNFQKSLPEQTNQQATQQATAAKRTSSSQQQQHQQQSGLLFNSFYSRLHSFLNPTAPLLPRVKNANAFGGSRQPGILSLVLQSKLIRFFALFYIIFSVFLSLNHTWKYLFHWKSTKQADAVVYDDFVPHRTYDAGNNNRQTCNSNSNGIDINIIDTNRRNVLTYGYNDTWRKNAQVIFKELLRSCQWSTAFLASGS